MYVQLGESQAAMQRMASERDAAEAGARSARCVLQGARDDVVMGLECCHDVA